MLLKTIINCHTSMFRQWQSQLLVILSVLCIFVNHAVCDNVCEPVKTSDCSCKAGGFTFSLQDLMKEGIKDGPPWMDKAVGGEGAHTEDTNTYSYNPCNVLRGSSCNEKDLAICQKVSDTEFHSAGAQPAVFVGDPRASNENDQLNFTYTGKDDRTSVVMMRCSKSVKFEALGETFKGSLKYEFRVSSPYACIATTSAGTIMVIIFFVLVLSYLLCGLLYMRFVRGARGWEQIPNLEFWRGLPGAAKDGCVFVFSGCKTDTTYSQI